MELLSRWWSLEGPVLFKSKLKRQLPSYAPAMLASTVMAEKTVSAASATDSDFEPFIADAFVSLASSEKKVLIKLLRDTGAKHSFTVEPVLPFSHETETRDFIVLYLVITLSLIELVRGVVPVSVRPRCHWMA